MKFRELPSNQQLLFVAHTLAAVAGLLAAFANILSMTERATLPNEVNRAQQPGEGRSRSGFFDS